MEDKGGSLPTRHIKCVACGVQKKGGLAGRYVTEDMIKADIFQHAKQWLCITHYNQALKDLKHAKQVCLSRFQSRSPPSQNITRFFRRACAWSDVQTLVARDHNDHHHH